MENQHMAQRLNRIQSTALIAGGVGLLGCLLGLLLDARSFFPSYLLAFMFWMSLTLGFLGLVMLHHMTSGRWSFVILRIAEAGMRVLPLMALLFVPIILGAGMLYPWMHGEELHGGKAVYLTFPFWTVRAIVYFAIWIVMASFLSRWSLQQDRSGDPALTRSLRLLSAPGIIVYVLTATFASTDWAMSLQPEWHSSIWGMLAVVGQVLGALAAAAVVLRLLVREAPFADVAAPANFLDLGNMILAFVVLWAYMSFSQFLIIWAGNLPDEILFYRARSTRAWETVAMLLALFHFAVPFLLLLIRRSKKLLRRLALIAGGLLIMRLVDMYWVLIPGIRQSVLHWADLAALLAIGGFWVAFFAWQLKAQPAIPRHDPRFAILTEPAQS